MEAPEEQYGRLEVPSEVQVLGVSRFCVLPPHELCRELRCLNES